MNIMKVRQSSRPQGKHKPARPTLRNVALPAEHGGWGFLLEPLLLGLLVTPSLAAGALAVAVVAAFLLRQPAKVILVDKRRGRTFPRTKVAWRVALIYAGIALVGVLITWRLAGVDWLLPPLLALPFGLVFLYYDMTQPGRAWQAELAAPLALASATASMAIIDGWMLEPSLALWAVLAARAVPSILYVRSRLRLDRGKTPDRTLPVVAHMIALLVVLTLIVADLLPWLAAAPFVLLLLRAVHGLSARRWPASIKRIGFAELGLGALTVVLVAAGYAL